MQIRIDRRAERTRAFKLRIEIEAQLARHVEIGALLGRNYDAIGGAENKLPQYIGATNRAFAAGYSAL